MTHAFALDTTLQDMLLHERTRSLSVVCHHRILLKPNCESYGWLSGQAEARMVCYMVMHLGGV